MPTNVFVSYPVDDLARSTAFYTALGAEVDPALSGDDAVCFVWSETFRTMVLRREFFSSFTDRQVGDARDAVQFQISFTRDSRGEVDAVIEAGLAAGGTEHGEPQEYGPTYARDLQDPDGYVVSFTCM